MTLRADREGRIARFSPHGAVTGGGPDGILRDQIARAIAAGATRIEINLSGVRYLDAAGLGELVACRTLARAHEVTLRLTGAMGKALEMLRLTGLDRWMAEARPGVSILPLGKRVA